MNSTITLKIESENENKDLNNLYSSPFYLKMN
jgi:hypothetical protein